MQKTTYITADLTAMHYMLILAVMITLSYGVTYVEMRVESVRDFYRRLNMDFYVKITLNPALTDENKAAIGVIYYNKLPSFFTLLFTRKPLQPDKWFTQSELNLFFNANPINS